MVGTRRSSRISATKKDSDPTKDITVVPAKKKVKTKASKPKKVAKKDKKVYAPESTKKDEDVDPTSKVNLTEKKIVVVEACKQ